MVAVQPLKFGAPLPPFIGRDAEREALVVLLQEDEVRLLTLTGPGGVGKTRLAITVASDLADRFPGGVTFVSLAPIRSSQFVLPTIASKLDVAEMAGQSLLLRLGQALKSQRSLLVLDNMEHLTAAAPEIGALLASCPGLKALITSRQPLHLSYEQEFAVQPLAVPRSGHGSPTISNVGDSDAAALFVERVKAVRPGFELTEGNAATVAEICARLDGLPLALELAAARCKLLSPAALLARLSSRLQILTGGSRDTPERLQTMGTAIAWSYDLLSPQQQALFRGLSVFVSGFTLEAAEAVVGSAVDSDNSTSHESELSKGVLNGLAELVDHSLVVRAESGDGRLRMLETIREYGLDQLAIRGEEDVVRRRHAAWCVALTGNGERKMLTADLGNWLTRYEIENDNLRAALDWSISGRESTIDVALNIVSDLWVYWITRGLGIEGRRWADRALEYGDHAPAAIRAGALSSAASMAWFQGDYRQVGPFAERALPLWQEVGSVWGVARCRHLLGNVAWDQRDDKLAIELLNSAIAGYAEVSEQVASGHAKGILAMATLRAGNPERAFALAESAVTQQRAGGHPSGLSLALFFMGTIAAHSGNSALAIDCFRESVTHVMIVGDRSSVIDPLTGLLSLAATTGHPEIAARLLGFMQVFCDQLGVATHPLHEETQSITGALARAALGEGAFTVALEQGRSLSLEAAISEAMTFKASGTMAIANQVPELTLHLTARELEVLRQLAAGKSNQELAQAMGISVLTAKTHVRNLFAKLELNSRSAAAVYAHRNGLA